MKLRSLLFIGLAFVILSSCGVNDLEDRLDKIENALFKVLRDGKTRTRDIGGEASTHEYADAIIAAFIN